MFFLRCGSSTARQPQAWLRVYRLPVYAPELNPAEGIWSLLKRAMVNFAAPTWTVWSVSSNVS